MADDKTFFFSGAHKGCFKDAQRPLGTIYQPPGWAVVLSHVRAIVSGDIDRKKTMLQSSDAFSH